MQNIYISWFCIFKKGSHIIYTYFALFCKFMSINCTRKNGHVWFLHIAILPCCLVIAILSHCLCILFCILFHIFSTSINRLCILKRILCEFNIAVLKKQNCNISCILFCIFCTEFLLCDICRFLPGQGAYVARACQPSAFLEIQLQWHFKFWLLAKQWLLLWQCLSGVVQPVPEPRWNCCIKFQTMLLIQTGLIAV